MRRKLITVVAIASAVVVVFAAGRAEQAKRAIAGRYPDPTDAVIQSSGGDELRASFKGTSGKTQSWFLEDRAGPVVRSAVVSLRTANDPPTVVCAIIEVGVGVCLVPPSLWTGDGVYRATFTPHVGTPSARDVTIHLPSPIPE